MRTRLRKAWLALLAVPVLSLGCTAKQASDVTGEACAVDAVAGAGLPPWLQTIFTTACQLALQAGMSGDAARAKGLSAARDAAQAASNAGARFPDSDGGTR